MLGFLNRGRHPLLLSGVWDGIGLLFGVSGFLLFAGPAVLSTLSERWRLFWLLFPGDVPNFAPDGAWPLWVFLSVLYFLLVVGGAALYLWRQRHLTAIYNANADLIEHALTDICKTLGLNPVCSGRVFRFGPSADGQEQSATLEVDSFPLLHHVTLRWEPAASNLRRQIEAELNRHLEETLPDDELLGGWLLTLGFILLSFDLVGFFFLIVVNLRAFIR